MRRRQRQRLLVTAYIVVVVAIVGGVAWHFRTALLELLPTPPVVVTVADNGKTITVLQGQTIEIRLPANQNGNSTWHLGIELPFVQQISDPTFTPSTSPSGPGDGYQATTFRATQPGTGPLFMSLLPDNDQASMSPTASFHIVLVVH